MPLLKELLSQHPLLIVIDVVGLVLAAGLFAVLLREAALFRGYRRVRRVAQGLAARVRGKIFRDGSDLVIHGFYIGYPVVIRFSNSESTPDLHLWMKVASRFNLFVTHNSVRATEGRWRIPSGDTWFDERFSLRSDQRDATVAFLANKAAVDELKRMCCSPTTMVALNAESIELAEGVMPQPDTLKHVIAHLESLGSTAKRVGALSRIKNPKNPIYVPHKFVLARAALVLLVCAGIVEVGTALHGYRAHEEDGSASAANSAEEIISPLDESQLPAIEQWRLATPADFDANTVTLLENRGQQVKGRYDEGFSDAGAGFDTAYVLVRQKEDRTHTARVILVSQHHVVLDLAFPEVVAVARASNAALRRVEWEPTESAPGPSDGDGLMLIRRVKGSLVATVFDCTGGKARSRTASSAWDAAVGD